MSDARVPSSGLRGGSDDEGDGVAIGVNEWIIGSKWEPPGGLSFKQYGSARVADKFAEEGATTVAARTTTTLTTRMTTSTPTAVADARLHSSATVN
jgi:hypothetical protein